MVHDTWPPASLHGGLGTSWLSPTVLEEGTLQEGGQLGPVFLRGRKEAWGDGGARPTLRPPGPARAARTPRGRSRSAPAQLQGPARCQLQRGHGQGRGARHEATAAWPALPRVPPHPWVPAQHTWKEVVGELPVQPVLQHQKQRELRRQEGKVGCRRRPSPTLPPSPGPGSRASAPCPHFSPGYIASGSPGGGRAQGHPQGSHLATEGPEQRCLKGAQKEQ